MFEAFPNFPRLLSEKFQRPFEFHLKFYSKSRFLNFDTMKKRLWAQKNHRHPLVNKIITFHWFSD